MHKGIILGIILAVIILFTGCSQANADSIAEVMTEEIQCKELTVNVEEAVQKRGKSIVDKFDVDKNIRINIEKKTDRFILRVNEEIVLTMLINCDFYDSKPMEIPVCKAEMSVPESIETMLENAKDIVVQYVEQSQHIKSEDKEKCKEAIRTVKLHNCEFAEDEEDVDSATLMATKGNEIYINNSLKENISEKEIIHELIHVLSNVTNHGTKYENSSYRASFLNEAITDIIANEISVGVGIPIIVQTTYEYVFSEAYFMIGKFDMLDIYYYSDGYANISPNMLDLFILILNNYYDGSSLQYAPLIENEFARTK